MIHLKGLHALAAERGDGLRQEFLELLSRHEALGAANVEDISVYLAEHYLRQAGPNPSRRVDDALPEGVLRLDMRETAAANTRLSRRRA